jgi:hypothetical protein
MSTDCNNNGYEWYIYILCWTMQLNKRKCNCHWWTTNLAYKNTRKVNGVFYEVRAGRMNMEMELADDFWIQVELTVSYFQFSLKWEHGFEILLAEKCCCTGTVHESTEKWKRPPLGAVTRGVVKTQLLRRLSECYSQL